MMPGKDILLFAGQGSLLSADKAELISKSVIATKFLETCHESLISEFNSLSAPERVILEGVINSFPSPQSLVDPHLQNHPVIQGIALYTHQILDFISYTAGREGTIHKGLSRLSETAGFCSGILPAVVVSLCPEPGLPEFLNIADSGFRLVFWVGIRSFLFCQRLAGDHWNKLPWSLTIQGLGVPELDGLLAEFNRSLKPKLPLRISAILSERVVSIVGEGQALSDFRSKHLPRSAPSRFANIHGYYHGGNILREALEEVLEDADRREILFPSWDSLRLPVRSTLHGAHLNSSGMPVSLLEALLQNIYIHQADWKSTADQLANDALEQLDKDSTLQYDILAIGPNSKSLLRAINGGPSHPRMRVASFVPGNTDSPSPDDIAIVGMSVNFPSGKGPDQLWDTLEKGLNVVQEVPSSRFKISDYYEAESSNRNPRKMNARCGNFLEDPFAFDSSFFQISPREAKSMDPQQRLLLHAALEAMEDAGYSADSTPSFQRDSTGVYVGVATLDYTDNTRNDIDVYYSPGTLRAFLSGRISYAFQLKGPSVVVDTACSSSTVAIYQACRALQAGDCTSALAGGVNVISSPNMYLGLARAHFLSPTGQCKPWDADADGYSRGEGCGLFVLKRLSDAVAEGDRIYGVIRGIEVNQCGTAKSITHPDSDTQAKLFKSLFTKSKIDPNTVSVVEAHGTGTQAGDYAEVSSLQAAFGSARASNNPLILSSIKGNIGHAEAASGAAGLAKLLMMMQKQRIPPQAAHQKLNPRLATIAKHNMAVPKRMVEWTSVAGIPRRALLNNFGAAGSNAALVVEEHMAPRLDSSRASKPRSCHLLNLSAKTADALEKLRQDYCAYMRAADDQSLASLCYSANARKQHFDAFRLSVTGHSTHDMLGKLQHVRPARPSKQPFTVFVFSGQGSVYPGMGAELLATTPVFRDSVRRCNEALAEAGFPRVDGLLGDEAEAYRALGPRQQAVVAQCACFVLEYGLARAWLAWGVQPDVLMGHSLGEYAALVVAGVVSLSDGLLLVARRAQLMTERCAEGSTGMAACNMAPAKVEELLLARGDSSMTVACKNSTEDCVVAGPVDGLKRFVEHCAASGVKAKMLKVPFAFHSAAMEPILEGFAELASTVNVNPPKIPIASSYLGRLILEEDITGENFARHARQPVEFQRATELVAKMAEGRKMTFVEVGPAPITLPMVKATLKRTDATLLPSMKPTESPWLTISAALSALYLHRYDIKWRQVYHGLTVRFMTDLPRYPLSPTTFVIPYAETNDHLPRPPYSFLDGSQSASSTGILFHSKTSTLADFIKAHNVGGAPLCPASVYIELALEALHLVKPSQAQFCTLSDLTFQNPLVYSEPHDTDLHTELEASGSSFRVFSRDSTLHCTGLLPPPRTNHSSVAEHFARRSSYIKRQEGSVAFVDTVSSRMLYDVIFPRVVAYSGPYVTIQQLRIAASGLEATGTFRLPRSGRDGHRFVCPPAFTDTLLHAAGFVANSKVSADEACICVKVEHITVPCGTEYKTLYRREMRVYCGLVECLDDVIVGDAYALDGDGAVVACIEGMHFKRLRLRSFQAHLARAMANTPVQQQQQKEPTLTRKDSGLGNEPASPRSLVRTTKESHTKERAQPGMRTALYNSLSEICGTAPASMDENTRLSDMGFDSLLLIELTSTLERRFPDLRLNGSDFSNCETVLDIARLVEKAAIGGTSTPQFQVVQNSDSEQANETTVDVVRLDGFFREVCGFSLLTVDKDTTLDALGVDSLLAIELASAIREAFGIELDESSIPGLRVQDVEKALFPSPAAPSADEKEKATGSDYHGIPDHGKILRMDEFPMRLQKSDDSNSAAPLFLFHDGSGLCNVYSRLERLGRNVYGIFSIDFAHIDPSIATLQELASRYIDKAGLRNHERILLGGWSFGGVLAFEISRQLGKQRPRSVQGVVLLDSPHPVSHEPLPEAVISHVCGQMPGNSSSPALRSVRAAIEAQFRRNARLLGAYHPDPAPGSEGDGDAPCVLLKCSGTFDAEKVCGIEYPWLSDEAFRVQSARAWERLVGAPVPVLDVEGNHFNLFSSENVRNVSAQLKEACQMLDR